MTDVLNFTIGAEPEHTDVLGLMFRPVVHLNDLEVWLGDDHQCYAYEQDAIDYGKRAFARQLRSLLSGGK